MLTAQTRVCTKCGQDLSLDLFGKHPKGLLGRNSSCKECCKLVRKLSEQKKEQTVCNIRCTVCNLDKSSLEYYKSSSKCKECISLQGKKWRVDNKEESVARAMNWAKNNRQKSNAIKAAYKVWNPDASWKSALKCKYGITPEIYYSMLESQNNACMICKKAETATRNDKIVRLSVDHNHETGEVRGLLCKICNVNVGIIENETNTSLVQDYLKRVETGQLLGFDFIPNRLIETATGNDRETQIRYNLKKFGITLEEYNKMLESQENKCAMCFELVSEDKSFAVDHCHLTNKIRGLLHMRCNIILGIIETEAKQIKNYLDCFNLESEK